MVWAKSSNLCQKIQLILWALIYYNSTDRKLRFCLFKIVHNSTSWSFKVHICVKGRQKQPAPNWGRSKIFRGHHHSCSRHWTFGSGSRRTVCRYGTPGRTLALREGNATEDEKLGARTQFSWRGAHPGARGPRFTATATKTGWQHTPVTQHCGRRDRRIRSLSPSTTQ